jgi:hypothetical protein
MTDRGSSSGGMTGATGDLTPDTIQRDFEPGELREVSDPAHQADVTQAQAARAPAQAGEVGSPSDDRPEGGPTELATRESGYGSDHGLSPEDPAYRMERRPRPKPEQDRGREPRDGGDERTDHEEHF